MLNLSGVFAVLDHGVTLNWDDGPTLHKISAQVRYHTAESSSSKTLRVTASSRYSDDPVSFVAIQDGLRASWVWQERDPGWTTHLSVVNEGEDDIYLDALDILRIDTVFGGLFNIGAPPGLWQVSGDEPTALLAAPTGEDSRDTPVDSLSSSPATLAGFRRSRELIVRPSASNRSTPPALLFRVLDAASTLPTELVIEANGERFERFYARYKTAASMIANGAGLITPEIWIAAGDDVAELKNL
jgi:hypothetical protein